MFGVDSPHFETIHPSTMDRVVDLLASSTIGEEDAQGVLFDSAAEVWGFDRNALTPLVERVGSSSWARARPRGGAGGSTRPETPAYSSKRSSMPSRAAMARPI